MDGREKDFRIVNRNRHNFRSQNGTLNNRPRFQASENPNPILGQAVSTKDSNDQLNKVCFKCNCKCRSDVKRCVFCGSPLKDSRNVTSSFLSSKPQRDSRHQSKALNFDAINVEATHKRMEKYCGPDTITSKGTNVGMAAVEEKSSNDILNRSNGAISASSFYSPTLQRSSLLGRAEEKINQNLKASKEARTNSLTEKYTYCDLSVFKVYIGNYYTSGNSVRFYPNHIVFGCGEQLWKIFYSSIGKIYVQTDEFLFIYFTLNMNKFANDGNAQVTKHEIFEFFKTLKREHKFDPASEELTTRYIILKCFKGDVEMCRQLPMLSNQIALVNQPKSEIDMRWITRQIEEHCQGVHNFDFEKEVEEIHKEIPNPYYQKRETFTPASRSFNNNFKADSFKVDAIIDDDNDDDDTANQIFEREKSIKSDVKAKTFGSYLHTLGNTVKNMFSDSSPPNRKKKHLPLEISVISSPKKPKIVDLYSESEDEDEANLIPDKHADEILTFESIGGSSDERITLYLSDLKCLEDREFLNDTIIGFYLLYIKTRIPPWVSEKTYILNTFFYSTLKSKKKNDSHSLSTSQNVYNRVKNWTKNIDIFEYDYIIIPLNESKHWFLAIICNASKSSSEKSYLKRPCIILMDSLRELPVEPYTCRLFRHFLEREWSAKKGREKSFGEETCPYIRCRLPQQTNGYDCGLYLLQYVEYFLNDPAKLLGSIERNCLNVEHWFGKGFIQTKRKRILSCIRKLSLKQRADAEMTSDDSTQSPIASRDDMEDFLNDCKTLDASQVSEMDCQEQSEMDCDDPEITHEFSRIQSQSHTEILSSDEEDMAAVLRSSPTRSIETDDEDGIHQIVVKKKVPVHRKLYPIFFESGSENDKF